MKLKILLVLCIASVFMMWNDYQNQNQPDCGHDLNCISDQLKKTAQKSGSPEAISTLENLLENSVITGAECHDLTHVIGGAIYTNLKENPSVSLPPNNTLCGYGIFHGYMEALVLDSINPVEDIKKFCDNVLDESQSQNQGVRSQCYHGVGHGAVTIHEITNKEIITQTIRKGLELCQEATAHTGDDRLFSECAYGVYGGIIDTVLNPSPSMKMAKNSIINPSDEYASGIQMCAGEPDRLQGYCYETVASYLHMIDDCSIEKSLPKITTIPKTHQTNMIRGITSSYAFNCEEQKKNPQEIITACQKLADQTHQIACVKGFAGGILSTGSPGKEPEQANSFCEMIQTNNTLKTECVGVVIRYIATNYPKNTRTDACKIFSNSESQLCLEE